MTTWRNNRQNTDTKWKTHGILSVISWKSREESSNDWRQDRWKHGTYSRKYMLGSFFDILLTAILDPKDGRAIRIKSDPMYIADPEFNGRKEGKTTWHHTRI